MRYAKPPFSYEEQADLLIKRGLIADRELLICTLKNVNYYRLSAYLYPYRKTDDSFNSFQENTSFDLVWKHYTFDRQLRLLVIDAIERVEVSIKTNLSYNIAHQYGPFGYLKKDNYPTLSPDVFEKWKNEIRSEVGRSQEAFVSHFFDVYGDCHKDLPIWMATETMSFGKVLTLYRWSSNKIRGTIAGQFMIPEDVRNTHNSPIFAQSYRSKE